MATLRRVSVLVAVALAAGCTPALGGSPTPDASSAQVAFAAADAEGGFPVTVTVLDFSTRLAEARAVTTTELAVELGRRPMEGAAGQLTAVEGSDRAVLAIWGGAWCDASATITIAPGVASLAIAPARPPACVAPWSTYRGAYLEFDQAIAPATIQLVFR